LHVPHLDDRLGAHARPDLPIRICDLDRDPEIYASRQPLACIIPVRGARDFDHHALVGLPLDRIELDSCFLPDRNAVDVHFRHLQVDEQGRKVVDLEGCLAGRDSVAGLGERFRDNAIEGRNDPGLVAYNLRRQDARLGSRHLLRVWPVFQALVGALGVFHLGLSQRHVLVRFGLLLLVWHIPDMAETAHFDLAIRPLDEVQQVVPDLVVERLTILESVLVFFLRLAQGNGSFRFLRASRAKQVVQRLLRSDQVCLGQGHALRQGILRQHRQRLPGFDPLARLRLDRFHDAGRFPSQAGGLARARRPVGADGDGQIPARQGLGLVVCLRACAWQGKGQRERQRSNQPRGQDDFLVSRNGLDQVHVLVPCSICDKDSKQMCRNCAEREGNFGE